MKFKKFVPTAIVESIEEVKEPIELETDRAVESYRKYANLEEGVEVTAENLDEWALNEAANESGIQPYDLKHTLLNEDKTIDQAARELEATEAEANTQNQVDAVLDRALKVARRKAAAGAKGDFPNILLVSDAGFGKTDMVFQWAEKNGINLVQKNLGTMGPEAFGGIVTKDAEDPRYATRIGTNEMIKALEKPNSVLFLDEYNRSKTEIRGAVLTLVQNHRVWDPTEPNGERFLDNFLFTIAAINPPNANYKGAKEMDPAELTRFRRVPMRPDPMEHLKYLKSVYTKEIEDAADDESRLESEGRLALATTLLSSPDFTYDSGRDIDDNADDPAFIPTNYRSVKRVLDDSDGTKDDFLSLWNDYCNYKKKPTVERILKNYVDVQDKANDALKDGTDSEVFGKTNNPWDALTSVFPELVEN